MKDFKLLVSALAMAGAVFMFSSCSDEQAFTEPVADLEDLEDGQVIKGKYVITLGQGFESGRVARQNFISRDEKIDFYEGHEATTIKKIDKFLAGHGISPESVSHYYSAAIVGFAAQLTDDQVKALRADNTVLSLEEDVAVKLNHVVEEVIEAGSDNGRTEAQTTPCGITRAGGAKTSGVSTSILAWVVDTGIDLDHPDLRVATQYSSGTVIGRSFVGGSANDCNGHGTHVAGTIGAVNNSIGVVGVAAGAYVIPVRVFGCSGGSSSSTITAGINHVAKYDYNGDVMNLSLGGYAGPSCSSSNAYMSSINAVANGGTKIAIAAGNSSAFADYYQPGCIDRSNVLTVASMTCNRSFSSFSNYGRPPIDFIATGSSVYSTYLNGGYATLSGTSMAAPHVAGILVARNKSNPRTCGSVTRSGVSYPIACR